MVNAHNSLSHYDRSKVADGTNFRIALVVSEWNEEITQALFQGAKEKLLIIMFWMKILSE